MLHHCSEELCASEGWAGVLLDLTLRTRLIWMKITSKISSLITSCYNVSREKGSSGPLVVSRSRGQCDRLRHPYTFGLTAYVTSLMCYGMGLPLFQKMRDTSKLPAPSLVMQILLSWPKICYVQVIGTSLLSTGFSIRSILSLKCSR